MTYNPNDYDEVLNNEYDEVEATDVLTFSESWDLPKNYAYVVRAYVYGKVEERSFKNKNRAFNYVKLLRRSDTEYVIYDHEKLEHNALVESD